MTPDQQSARAAQLLSNEQLSNEIAYLKCRKFAKRSDKSVWRR
jgi:hypothetical protein